MSVFTMRSSANGLRLADALGCSLPLSNKTDSQCSCVFKWCEPAGSGNLKLLHYKQLHAPAVAYNLPPHASKLQANPQPVISFSSPKPKQASVPLQPARRSLKAAHTLVPLCWPVWHSGQPWCSALSVRPPSKRGPDLVITFRLHTPGCLPAPIAQERGLTRQREEGWAVHCMNGPALID